MKKLATALCPVLILVIIAVTLPVFAAEADTIWSEPTRFILDLHEKYASNELIKLYIGNRSSQTRLYHLYLNQDWGAREPDELSFPTEWLTGTPSGQSLYLQSHDSIPDNWLGTAELPPNGDTVFNFTIDIPYAEDGKYKAWLHITDEPYTMDKVLPLVIRSGSAIPLYDYSIAEGSVFNINVTGPYEEQWDDSSAQFTIVNKGAASKFLVYARQPDSLTHFNEPYLWDPQSLSWTDWAMLEALDYRELSKQGIRNLLLPQLPDQNNPDDRLFFTYLNEQLVLDASKIAGIFTIVDHPTTANQTALEVSILGGVPGRIFVPVRIPSHIANEKYATYLQVACLGQDDEVGQGGGIVKQYAIKLLYTLSRQQSPSATAIWIAPIAAISIAILIAALFYLNKNRYRLSLRSKRLWKGKRLISHRA